MAEPALVDNRAIAAPSALPDRLRAFCTNPAAASIRPAIIVAATLLLALIGWNLLREPAWRPLYAELSDGD